VISVLVVALLVGLSFVIGPSRPNRRKLQAYESGIVPTARARHRMSVRFYLTAMLFIVFDIEAVFFYPWAVVLHQLRWYGLIEMFVFMFILLVALAHIWRKGGLEWD
jgi:NADH-quinone oxidoreductase subunit A